MVRRAYTHPEYSAQVFRDYLHIARRDKDGSHIGGIAALQKGNRVLFPISKVCCEVTFECKGNDLYSTLEMKMGENRSKPIPIPVNVKRSKTGRISGNHGEGFEEYFGWVMDFVRKFYQDSDTK